MPAPRSTPIGELMTTPPVVVDQGMWFTELVRRMDEHDIGCLPVIDRSGRVMGVVTDADLLLKACREWLERRGRGLREPASRQLERIKAAGAVARDLMTAPALTAPPTMPARDALLLLRRQGVKHLVVVSRAGAPLGVLSRRDLLVPLCRHDGEIRADVDDVADRVLRGRRSGVELDVDDGVVTARGTNSDDRLHARLLDELGLVEGVVAVRPDPVPIPAMVDVREVVS